VCVGCAFLAYWRIWSFLISSLRVFGRARGRGVSAECVSKLYSIKKRWDPKKDVRNNIFSVLEFVFLYAINVKVLLP